MSETKDVVTRGSSNDDTGSGDTCTPDSIQEKALLRKIDFKLVPALGILYLMAFLDRVNIGNVLTLGLPQDIELTGNQINVALAVFYVPYILFEVPSNIILKRLKPHVWLSGTMCSFGIVMLCHGFVKNYSGLIALRFFLGLSEAGVFPGCVYLISMWYKREEAQKRFMFFFQCVTLAGAFGGLLASGLYKMDGLRGLAGWRWIFIIEGILTVVLAATSFFLIPDFPDDANWLTEEERQFVIRRTEKNVDMEKAAESPVKALKRYFLEPKTLPGSCIYFGGVIVAYSLTYFLATILKGFHHSPIETQLLTVPPFAAGWVFSIILSFISDKFKHRFAFVLAPILIAIAGAGVLLAIHTDPSVEYGAVFLVVIGTFSALPMALCWYVWNLEGHGERAIGSAWVSSFGNIGGIIATFTFESKDAPVYHTGYSIVMFGLCLMLGATVSYLLILIYQNRSRGVKGHAKYML